jgi:hypothetical protein
VEERMRFVLRLKEGESMTSSSSEFCISVGIKEVDDGIWLVSFMDYDLGYIDLEKKTLQPLNNPLAQKCKACLRNAL